MKPVYLSCSRLFSALIVLAIALGKTSPALSQASNIVPDDTLGDESSEVIENFQGQAIEVIIEGARREQNLFHSFSEFNVKEGRGAYFYSPDPGIQNILSRVTGGNPSEIMGILGTFGESNPDLFLINPNGIIFGAGASLDVKGSFSATTASGIEFGEQGNFDAVNPQIPQLLTVNPSAYLFTQIEERAISSIESQATFSVSEGESLVFLGGDIQLTGSLLSARRGEVMLGGLQEAGKVAIADKNLIFPDGAVRGDVSLSNTFISVFAGGGGGVKINARNFSLSDGSSIFAGIASGMGSLAARAGDIVINATEDVVLDGGGSNTSNSIANDNFGTGNAGDIQISARNIYLTNGGNVTSFNDGSGNSGDIALEAKENIIFEGSNDFRGSGILSFVSSTTEGNSSNISIISQNLFLENAAGISSQVSGRGNSGKIQIDVRDTVAISGVRSVELSDGTSGLLPSIISNAVNIGGEGDSGDINLTTDSLSITNNGQIDSSIFGGRGNGGDINIKANNISIDGRNNIAEILGSGIRSSNLDSRGNGGDITIVADFLSLTNGGDLRTSTNSNGNGGDIKITATNDVTIDGQNENGTLSQVNASVGVDGAGNGGNVDITTTDFSLTDNARLVASSSGEGNAGGIQIAARDTVFVDRGLIVSNIGSVSGVPAIGKVGSIQIDAREIILSNTAQIQAGLYSGATGEPGIVALSADESISFTGEDTGIFNNNEVDSIGDASDVELTAPNIVLNDGAVVTASNEANDRGGNITFSSQQLTLNNSDIRADVFGTGDAGTIEIQATDVFQAINGGVFTDSLQSAGGTLTILAGDIRLRGNSDLRTNVASGSGGGGNITLTADSIVAFDDSDIFAFAADGRGGNIILDTPAFFAENFTLDSLTANPNNLDNNDRADLNATGAVSGAISIPDVSFIQNSLTELPDNAINTDSLVADSCVVPSGEQNGTFVVTGGGGLPTRPEDTSIAPYATGDVQTVAENSSSWQKGKPILEPQGMYQLSNGELVLSRECDRS